MPILGNNLGLGTMNKTIPKSENNLITSLNSKDPVYLTKPHTPRKLDCYTEAQSRPDVDGLGPRVEFDTRHNC